MCVWWGLMEVWRKGNSACFLVMARLSMGFPSGSDGKESACNAGNLGSVPGSGRSPRKGNGNLLLYSCLENFIDREAWRATVHRVATGQTWLSDWYTQSWLQSQLPTTEFQKVSKIDLCQMACSEFHHVWFLGRANTFPISFFLWLLQVWSCS